MDDSGLLVITVVTLVGWLSKTVDAAIKRREYARSLAPIQYRKLEPHESVEERARLDSVARRLSGFTQLGDFIEVHPADVPLPPPRVQRALVDEPRTTMAIVRHDDPYDQIDRICLTTALNDGRWIMTQKNFARSRNEPFLPTEIDLLHYDWEVPISELLAKHAKRVAEVLEHVEEGYRSAGGSNAILIRTMDDCLDDHVKRAELIRAKRKPLASRS